MIRLIEIISVCLLLAIINFSCGNANNFTKNAEVIPENSPNDTPSENTVTIETISTAGPDSENDASSVEGSLTEIQWMDFETAIDKNAIEKKFIFIDMYTDWCGWCKKMDASTFRSKTVVDYISTHFYAVKMNPESKEAVAYKEVLYESKAYGSKMYNELAVNLLSGKMSFPSFVILNKREVKRGVIVGFQNESQLLNGLKRYVEQ